MTLWPGHGPNGCFTLLVWAAAFLGMIGVMILFDWAMRP